jgi:hypothetical protein
MDSSPSRRRGVHCPIEGARHLVTGAAALLHLLPWKGIVMAVGFVNAIAELAKVNVFQRDPKTRALETGTFVGRPFYLDYDKAHLLVADSWKNRAGGLPQGTFLLAYYENEDAIEEAILLRVLRPTALPTDRDVISSMVEHYKDDIKTSGKANELDQFTRYEFSFSGLECRVLGTFYLEKHVTLFGADLENFYSAHNYSVIKPHRAVLEFIVNFREGTGVPGKATDVRIGKVRYSSSRRFQTTEPEVPVYVSPQDFLGKRTAMFGMTRTGKSNTVKKVIQATVAMSQQAKSLLAKAAQSDDVLAFDGTGFPKYPVGQIIFDMNGEYANPNLQDEGTAISDLFKNDVLRFSTIVKPGFKVMKVNFFQDIVAGSELIKSHLGTSTGNYIESFRSIDLTRPDDYETNPSAKTRHDRRVAAYLCCLKRAGFAVPEKLSKIRFDGNKDLNRLVQEDGTIDPKKGISFDDAINWFTTIWDNYEQDEYFSKYRREHGHEWADEDLKAILVFLTRKRKPNGSRDVDGYLKLRGVLDLHTPLADQPFEIEIVEHLRSGRIVIIDLSQGDPSIQALYSERICRRVFMDAMDRFVRTRPNNFIQFYFEEAHNLFPKREDRDLSLIYNRVAKEGAKLNIGLLYATQEVSSISSNILKNTQNWFIAHLNNDDETREIKKYYDFGDFSEGLVRFSASSDKGFVRMKTYSNPFVVPVQIDRFPANASE